jgi:hypothetical protein
LQVSNLSAEMNNHGLEMDASVLLRESVSKQLQHYWQGAAAAEGAAMSRLLAEVMSTDGTAATAGAVPMKWEPQSHMPPSLQLREQLTGQLQHGQLQQASAAASDVLAHQALHRALEPFAAWAEPPASPGFGGSSGSGGTPGHPGRHLAGDLQRQQQRLVMGAQAPPMLMQMHLGEQLAAVAALLRTASQIGVATGPCECRDCILPEPLGCALLGIVFRIRSVLPLWPAGCCRWRALRRDPAASRQPG